MTQLLAGDIGGTKTLLRLSELTPTGLATLREASYPSAKFPHLSPIVRLFLSEAGRDTPPTAACFAIAGPVRDDRSLVTNLSWDLDARQMETELGIPQIRLINDFAAVGYGILALGPDDVVVLQDRPAVPRAPIAVLGAGTGLGEALLVLQENRYEVMATEGGHADFAPRTDLEVGLMSFLRERYGRVSVERVVSGRGIYRIYEYLRSAGFAPASAAVEEQLQQEDPSAAIAAHALSNSDALCTKALELFVAAYGAEAGNLALKSLPYGGLYLAGGVGAKILPKLQDGTFIENFLDKGRMRSLLENLRVSLIINPKVGLLGATLYAQKLI
ncbi:glucokinase [Altericista sp. CCNU0014]|uniref:glucokinase n=1 Tax=Altericista sp. CCNU0014 TaxID=3082949 RepID=UPI00384A7F51